ncbi:MAG: DUF799 family lipoprotein [Deltaproteobacteria bacterium]|nr:DUF799 family lipoprotein [Deltaproteobacteria bacterium]
MAKRFRPFFLLMSLFFLAGCAGKIPHTLVPDYAKKGTRLIAVLPVRSLESDDAVTASVLRVKLIEELYFKGYPKIPPKLIDERLATLPAGADRENPAPQAIGELLKADAVLYTTLREGLGPVRLLYSPVAVDAEFELKSAKTGESLWRARYRAVYRNYGITRKSLELKSSRDYEPAIQEVLDRALETLPDGPDAIGS